MLGLRVGHMQLSRLGIELECDAPTSVIQNFVKYLLGDSVICIFRAEHVFGR